jgi:diguanylate cyclase (GGDEF)-like protein
MASPCDVAADADLRRPPSDVVGEVALRPGAAFLAAVYAVLALLAALDAPISDQPITLPMLAGTAATFAALRAWLPRRSLSQRQVRTVAGAVAALSMSTTVVSLVVTPEPVLGMWVMLTVVATGALVRSTPWFVGVSAYGVGSYLVVATIAPPDILWSFVLRGIVASVVLASVLHLVVRRATLRLERARAALEAQAFTDALTGLPNRHALPGLFLRAKEAGFVSLLFVDVDGLKEVNDEAGHDAGDRLIVSVSHALRAAFRDADVVVRVGGDEFVVLLAGVPAEQGELFALRAEAACRPCAPYGVSVGAASSAGDRTLDQLLTAADRAMYEAKSRRSAARRRSA